MMNQGLSLLLADDLCHVHLHVSYILYNFQLTSSHYSHAAGMVQSTVIKGASPFKG